MTSAFTAVALEAVDPVNAAILLFIWWRLERVSARINRMENEFLERGINQET